MKKETTETKTLKPLLLNIGLTVFTLAVIGAIGYFLILPTYSQLASINEKITAEKNQADRIDQTIASLKSQDKAVLATISATFKGLVPTQIDMLHFASLNETIAKKVGVQVSGIQISKVIPAKNAKAPVATPTQTATLNIVATYKSNFTSLLNMIRAWMFADQEVGVKTIQISGDASGVINYTVTYDLPTSLSTPTVSIDDQLTLSKKQLEELENVKSKIIYTATPSAKPLGRTNPFSQ